MTVLICGLFHKGFMMRRNYWIAPLSGACDSLAFTPSAQKGLHAVRAWGHKCIMVTAGLWLWALRQKDQVHMSPTVQHDSSISTEHIQGFETKIQNAKAAFGKLPGADFYDELLAVIHRPGWTTPAEASFFEAVLDGITAHTQSLAVAHDQLLTAAKLVGSK